MARSRASTRTTAMHGADLHTHKLECSLHHPRCSPYSWPAKLNLLIQNLIILYVSHHSTPPKASKLLLHHAAIKWQKWPGFVQLMHHCTLCLTIPSLLQFPSCCILCLPCGHPGTSPCDHVLLNLSIPYRISTAGEGLSMLTTGKGVALMSLVISSVSSSSVQVGAPSSKAPTAG